MSSSSDVLNIYLIFGLNQQFYGIEIAKVSEIIAMKNITPLPQTPEFVEGMVNVRGKVIPIVNLRKKFDLPAKKHDRNTIIIIVYVDGNEMGIIVDTVWEVTEIKESLKETTPQFSSGVEADFIQAITKDEKGMKILLDIECILNSEELIIMNEVFENNE